MTKHPVALAIALAFAASTALSGCDRTSNLTEQEHIQRAKDFEDKGNLKGSIIELKNAIQKNPDSPQARLLLGQVYLKAGYGAEAEKELRQAEKLGVNRESIKPQLGEALLLMGEYKRVLDEIQPGEQTTKASLARILQLRANALLKQGSLKDACNLFQQSLDTDTDNPPTYWGLAQCAVIEHDMIKAREWLDVALKIKDRQDMTWVFIGDLEWLNNNTQAALNAYDSALVAEPSNLEALVNHATLSMALGQMDSASKDIEKAHKLAPNSLSSLYLQASYSFHQKKYPEARDALQKVFKINPDHMPSVLLAGTSAFALGSYQQAETYLNRYLKRYPGHSHARQVLAATRIKLNQPDKALETLKPLLNADTKDATALALAGEAHSIKREPEQAAAYFEKATAVDPKSAAIRTELGLARLAQGDSRAMTDLQAAADMGGPDNRVDTLLIQNQLKQKQFDDALTSIASLVKKQPQSPLPWSYRGAAYLGKNDVPKARESFNQALKLDPRFFPAAASLAVLDLKEGQPAQARKRFENILKADPGHLQAMLALADLNLMDKDEKGYMGWLEKAVQAHPQALPPRMAMARHLLAKGEKDKPLAIAREAVDANPDDPAALNLLGSTQVAIGDKVNAITTFITLTKKANQSPDAYLRLAMAQIANTQLADARVSLQRALKLKPNHLQSQDVLLRLELAEKKPEAALQIARQIQAQHPSTPLGFVREADIHMAQKRLPQAIQAYEQALAKGAGSSSLIKLHHAQILAGNTKSAEQRLDDWLRQHPNDKVARNYAAEYNMVNGRNREAITHYQEILRQTPINVIALNNLANLYLRVNDQRALATAEQALKLAPDNPTVQDTLGWILVEQGQAQRGLEMLRKAIGKLPKAATVRYHYAAALARSGEKARARKELEKLLADSPKFPEAEAAKALLKSL